MRLLEKNWKSFFNAIKEWSNNSEKFTGRPKLPKYKPKNGESIVVFTNQQCRIIDGLLCFPRKAQLPPIKTRVSEKFHQVRILPRGNHYLIEIVYDKKPLNLRLNKTRFISIDIGINNLVTVVNNAGLKPWRIKGGMIKSINQYYNKVRARLYSIKHKQGIQRTTKRLQRLVQKRNNKIIDIFHKISRRIIKYCIQNDFGNIIIGYNKLWKQSVKSGRRNNQNFIGIPFLMLLKQVQYKAALMGIVVILTEESHTSKVSFLDSESIESHETYVGKRVKRGLFRSLNGKLINSDVNAGYNIGRKAVPEAFEVDGIEGVGLHPFSMTI